MTIIKGGFNRRKGTSMTSALRRDATTMRLLLCYVLLQQSLQAISCSSSLPSNNPSTPSTTRFNMTLMGAYQQHDSNSNLDEATATFSTTNVSQRSTRIEEDDEESWTASSSDEDDDEEDDGDNKMRASAAMSMAASSYPSSPHVVGGMKKVNSSFASPTTTSTQSASASATMIQNAASNNAATFVKETNDNDSSVDGKLLVPPPQQLPQSLSFFRSQFSPRAPVGSCSTTQSYFESAFSAESDSENGGGVDGVSPVTAAIGGQNPYPRKRSIRRWQTHGNYIESILRDVDQLQNLNLDDDLTTPCHVVSRDKNYTRTWTHDDWEEYQIPALSRYWKHTLSLPYSTTARSVLPAVGVSFLYSAIVAVLVNPPKGLETMLHPLTRMVKRASSSLSSNALELFVTPMGMLLALKAQRAMDRLLEARREWGRMIRTVRTLSGLIMAHVTPTNPEMGFLIARYLICFGWSFKALLRQENDLPLLTNMLPYDESYWTLQQPHHPMAIICRIRYLLKDWLHDNDHKTSTAGDIHGELERCLWDLEQVIGICNRIVTSPMPPTYTRHTSRVLSLFLMLLPLSVAGMGLGKVAIVFTSTVITYIFAGIDEIGVEIEFPFWLLPMTNLATAAQKSVLGQITMMHTMPRLTSSVSSASSSTATTTPSAIKHPQQLQQQQQQQQHQQEQRQFSRHQSYSHVASHHERLVNQQHNQR